VPIYTSSPGDSSIGMNIAYHELMNDSGLMVDPNRDVNEVCAFILAGQKNGCVILGGGSPKNFYLQGQPTLWEVYGIPKGGNDYFIQITTDSVVWGGLSGATRPAVSWGKVNPGMPDTAVATSIRRSASPSSAVEWWFADARRARRAGAGATGWYRCCAAARRALDAIGRGRIGGPDAGRRGGSQEDAVIRAGRSPSRLRPAASTSTPTWRPACRKSGPRSTGSCSIEHVIAIPGMSTTRWRGSCAGPSSPATATTPTT
jgi:hypothetical protein